MSNEYKLPYTASEINRKLRDVDTKANVVAVTTAEYEAIDNPNANTLYMITDAEGNDEYYTQLQIDEKFEQINEAVSNKSDVNHNHNDVYDTKGAADTAINSHNTSTDAHSNMGWLTSEDEITSSPTPFDADTLNGRNAAYFDNQIAIERARINQIASLDEGSTTGDAELVDIRVGWDGTTYESAGEAVRTQIEKCTTPLINNVDLSDINIVTGYISGLDGYFASSSTSYKCTDYIDISGFDGSTLSVTAYINGNCGFAIYDKNKKFLYGACGNTEGYTADAKKPQTVQCIIPDGGYYVRFTMMNNGDISSYPMSLQVIDVIKSINNIAKKEVSNGKTRDVDLLNINVVQAYIKGDDGKQYDSTSYLATDFIPVPCTAGSTITFKSMLIGNIGFSLYDKNQKFLYGLNGNSEGVTGNSSKGQIVSCIAPDNTYYIRFTMKSTDNISNYPLLIEYSDLATFAAATSKEIASESTTIEHSFCLVNPAVKKYMDEVTYPDDDYSYSCIWSNGWQEGRDYGKEQLYRTDRPIPVYIKWQKDDRAVGINILLSTSYTLPIGGDTSVTYNVPFGVDRFPIYNLLPNTEYFYRVTALYSDGTERVLIEKDSFKTTADHLRMIYIDGCGNMRDLGGWSTYDASGNKTGTVKYKQLYRGAALDSEYYYDAHISSDGATELTKYIGIQAELDLRGGHTRSSSPIAADLQTDSNYLSVYYQSCLSLFTDEGRSATKAAFEFILAKLNEKNTQKSNFKTKPVYYHCLGGADRTGTLTYLLLGVLGVSESDITKDYELTSFSCQGYRLRSGSEYGFREFVTQLKTYSGNTLQEKITTFLLECGISSTDIESFKSKMIKPV